MNKPKYKVNLHNSQSVCDLNYARLCKLMPSSEQCDQWDYRLSQGDKVGQDLRITITERAPYTTFVRLEQKVLWTDSLPSLILGVRIYHDVTMAEVVEWSRSQPRHGNYEYPNEKMYHADEKIQLNIFLSEWLSLCLAQGHTLNNSSFTADGQAVIK